MRTNADCAKSTVIQPKLTYHITMQQYLNTLQAQMIQSKKNTSHLKVTDLYTVYLDNMNVENHWLLSTNHFLSHRQVSSSQLYDDSNVPSWTSSNKQQYNPM